MQIKQLRSDTVYQKILAAPAAQKDDIYRYELMQPFWGKWACYHIPLKAAQQNGFDVVKASSMLGFLAPAKVDESKEGQILLLCDDTFWHSCNAAVTNSLEAFANAGVDLPVKTYLFTVLLADPDSPYTKLNDGYCGDGGIPGYIFGSLTPNARTMARMPAALAHECNHNVRFQFEPWKPNISLGEMMVAEGLAENFAAAFYGENAVGPWVTKTDAQTLQQTIKPVIRKALGVSGMSQLAAYLYGDEIASLQGAAPVGLPYCAGYACGYHLIRYYLNKTGKTVVEATLTPAKTILDEVAEFWQL